MMYGGRFPKNKRTKSDNNIQNPTTKYHNEWRNKHEKITLKHNSSIPCISCVLISFKISDVVYQEIKTIFMNKQINEQPDEAENKGS